LDLKSVEWVKTGLVGEEEKSGGFFSGTSGSVRLIPVPNPTGLGLIRSRNPQQDAALFHSVIENNHFIA
jgi:hypothetical protein